MWIFELINCACAVLLVLILGYATALCKDLVDAFKDIWRGK